MSITLKSGLTIKAQEGGGTDQTDLVNYIADQITDIDIAEVGIAAGTGTIPNMLDYPEGR